MIKLDRIKVFNFLLFIGAIVALIKPAILNGYPILFTDAGTYISSGYELYVPVDRPVIYGLFVWLFSNFWSLWFVIIAQSALVCYLLLKLIELFVSPKSPFFLLFIFSILLTEFTGIGYFCGQISPDILTFCGSASILLCFLKKNQSSFQKIIWALIVLFSSTAHYSNIPIFFGLFFLLAIYGIVYRKQKTIHFLKQMGLSLSAFALSIPLILSINYSLDAGFKLSRTSYVISGARFIESGLANKHLKRVCFSKNQDLPYQELCGYIDQFKKWPAAGFYLHSTDSPVFLGECINNGWEDCWIRKNEMYKALIEDILSQNDLRNEYIALIIAGSLNQFFTFEHGKIDTFPFLHLIEKYFPNEIESFKSANQNKEALYFYEKTFSEAILFVFSLLSLGYIILLKWQNIDESSKLLIIFSLGLLIINAGICATLSNVVPRYQGRIVFVLFFSTLLLLLKQLRIKKNDFTLSDIL